MACVENPSEWGLYPTIVTDHSNAIQSNRALRSPSAVDTQRPNPSQMTCVWCTYVSIDRPPQNLVKPIVRARRQILDYWKFSDYSPAVFYKRLPDASHNADYSWVIVQISMNRLGTRQIPLRRYNRGVHLCRYDDEFAPPPHCDWHWRVGPNRNVPN